MVLTHLEHGLIQGSLQRELGKQCQQRVSREKGSFIPGAIPASQVADHPTSVSILDLAKGTAVLRGCNLKSILYHLYAYKSGFVDLQDALQSDHTF